MKIGSTSLGFEISRELNTSTRAIARALERLSTGKRVNRPSDDPASYSVIQSLNSQIRGQAQAIQNINQSQVLLSTAETALQSQLELTQRMREIALQASGSTLTSDERQKLSKELKSITDEFDRIAGHAVVGHIDLLRGRSLEITSSPSNSISFDLPDSRLSTQFKEFAGTGIYSARKTVATGTSPMSVKVADLNQDGHLDIVEASLNSSVVGVLLGRGDGSFETRKTYSITNPQSIELTDVNQDGVLDILSTSQSGSASIFLGRGDGSFGSATTVSTGVSSATAIKVGDFNSDGFNDLVIAGTGSGFVSLLLGKVNGTYETARTFAIHSAATFIDIGDVNNDGNLDVINGSNFIGVLLGRGDGTLAAETTFNHGGGSIRGVTLADFDQDGDLDIAANATYLHILYNDGTGSYLTSRTYDQASSGAPWDLQLGDANGDGLTDIIATQAGENIANIFMSLGNGTFETRKTARLGTLPFSSALGDFNEDGVADVVSADLSDSTLSILMGIGAERSAMSLLDLSSPVEGQRLIDVVDRMQERLIENISNIAILRERLDFRSNSLLSSNEALTESQSRIEDADLAQETSELVREQILQQAQVAAFSQYQANLQIVLGLLRI